MKSNIVLIGMAASGKSTTGVVLAKTVNKKFIDTDLIIQEITEKTLQQILNEDGIETFKKVETDVLSTLKANNSVIATGGSAVYYPEAMDNLKKIATIVYLNVSYEDIESRLRNIKTRGVILEKGQTIKDLYDFRKPMYEKYADIVINTTNLSLEQTVEKICDELKL